MPSSLSGICKKQRTRVSRDSINFSCASRKYFLNIYFCTKATKTSMFAVVGPGHLPSSGPNASRSLFINLYFIVLAACLKLLCLFYTCLRAIAFARILALRGKGLFYLFVVIIPMATVKRSFPQFVFPYLPHLESESDMDWLHSVKANKESI